MTFTGLLIGMGQLLASTEKITPRIVIGRAFSSVGLALVAGVGLLQVPNMPLIALIGLSALFSSLGTSALETLFQRYMGIK
jgi:hypothetical protein